MSRILYESAFMSSPKLRPETTYQAVVGRVIVKIRKDLNKDQNALADAVGVNQSTWSRIERGDSPLSIDQLALAAGFMGIQPSIILQEAEIARKELEQQGVIVQLNKRQEREKNSGIAFLGGAALGALIGSAITKNKNSGS
jgi:transcriptional regulator with XRE-family HTH domain